MQVHAQSLRNIGWLDSVTHDAPQLWGIAEPCRSWYMACFFPQHKCFGVFRQSVKVSGFGAGKDSFCATHDSLG